jgi:hypothetical protein
MASAQWNITISKELDESVRMFMSSEGGNYKSDLPYLLETALRKHIASKSRSDYKDFSDPMNEDEPSPPVNWNIVVSGSLDQFVRDAMSEQGRNYKTDLSDVVESALQKYMFERHVMRLKGIMGSVGGPESKSLIETAMQFMNKY